MCQRDNNPTIEQTTITNNYLIFLFEYSVTVSNLITLINRSYYSYKSVKFISLATMNTKGLFVCLLLLYLCLYTSIVDICVTANVLVRTGKQTHQRCSSYK